MNIFRALLLRRLGLSGFRHSATFFREVPRQNLWRIIGTSLQNSFAALTAPSALAFSMRFSH